MMLLCQPKQRGNIIIISSIFLIFVYDDETMQMR